MKHAQQRGSSRKRICKKNTYQDAYDPNVIRPRAFSNRQQRDASYPRFTMKSINPEYNVDSGASVHTHQMSNTTRPTDKRYSNQTADGVVELHMWRTFVPRSWTSLSAPRWWTILRQSCHCARLCEEVDRTGLTHGSQEKKPTVREATSCLSGCNFAQKRLIGSHRKVTCAAGDSLWTSLDVGSDS